jgi:hypothetical protein
MRRFQLLGGAAFVGFALLLTGCTGNKDNKDASRSQDVPKELKDYQPPSNAPPVMQDHSKDPEEVKKEMMKKASGRGGRGGRRG